MTSLAPAPTADRVTRIKRSFREMVAEHGLGASMSLIARHAGVGTGTAYVHFRSKDELVLAAYLDAKRELTDAAFVGVDPGAEPRDRFLVLWCNVYEFFHGDSATARFLNQVDASPISEAAHAAAIAEDTAFFDVAAAPDMQALLIELPLKLLYELSLGVAARLAAEQRSLADELSPDELAAVAEACWRAVTRPDAET